jgi:hypothetical protein
MAIESVILVCGLVITYKAYGRDTKAGGVPNNTVDYPRSQLRTRLHELCQTSQSDAITYQFRASTSGPE